MHGTQCNGSRLKTKAALDHQDTLVFGADVTRGSCLYPLSVSTPCLLYANFRSAQFRALKVMVATSWSDVEYISQPHNASNKRSLYGRRPSPVLPLQLPSFRNTFSADYSEEDMYDDVADQDHVDDEGSITATGMHDDVNDDHPGEPSLAKPYGYPGIWVDYAEDELPDGEHDDDDDEVEIVKESIRAPSVEVVIPRRDESIIVSEESDRASSYFSEGEVDESPTSSPVGPTDDHRENSAHDSSAKVFHARADGDQEESAGAFPSPYPAEYVIPAEAVIMRSHSDSFIPASSLGSMYDAGSSSINKPLAQLHPSDTARAPSPSEVAMVKPSPEIIIQQPFLQPVPAYRDMPSYPLEMPGRDPAWDGPSWDFYDTPHPRFGASGNTCVRDTDQISFDAHYTHPTSQGPPYVTLPTLPAQYSNTPQPVQVIEADPTPKCSIAQLLDQPKKNDEQGGNTKKSLKRKVDKISDSTEEDQSFGTHNLAIQNKDLESGPLLESSNIVRLSAGHKSNVTPTHHVETTSHSAAEMVSEATDTQLRKKAKKDRSQGNDGGSFMKMAAATIAGVAIGTVGTIIGLASLPQDYFL